MAIYVENKNGDLVCMEKDLSQNEYLKMVEESCKEEFSCFKEAVNVVNPPSGE